MSDSLPPTDPAAKPSSSTLKRLGYGSLAVVIILIGLARTWQGVSAMFGWDGTSGFNALVEESNVAYRAALAHAETAQPFYQSLMEAVDAQPPADLRLEQKDNATQAIAAYKEAAKQFELAGKKIDEALALGVDLPDDHESSLKLRSKACGLLAGVCNQNAAMCETTLDESITTTEALVPRILELAAKRDATQKEADAAIVESQNLAKKIADNK